MRVLMTTTPALGHFTPLVNVGRALQLAEHTVAVATAQSFGDAVAARGFDLVPAGISGVEAFGRAAAADPAWRTATPEEIGRRIIPDVWVAQYARATMEDADRLIGWGPDVVVREEGEFASTLIAAMLGVPCVDVGWGPMRPPHLVDVADEALRELWLQHGQQPRENAGVYGWLYLDPCPPSLQPSYADNVDVLHRVQPVPAAPSPPASELPRSVRPPRRPAGGVRNPGHGTNLQRRSAVLPGRDRRTRRPRFRARDHARSEWSSGVVRPAARPRPYRTLRSAGRDPEMLCCPITNGGSGSTLGALASGVPVLTVSSAAAPSQMRNAQAAASFGAGRAMSRSAITADHIRHEVTRLPQPPAIRLGLSESPTKTQACHRQPWRHQRSRTSSRPVNHTGAATSSGSLASVHSAGVVVCEFEIDQGSGVVARRQRPIGSDGGCVLGDR